MIEKSASGTHHRGLSRLLGAYLITMRPYLLFVSGATGLAGMAFAPDLAWPRASLIFLASFLAYGFGQALTDCFQTDTDALSAPYRPLIRGVLVKRDVCATSVAGLVGCVVIFGLNDPITIPLGLLAAFGLATYTPFKRRWWGGPFYNAWIVVVLAVMAFLAARAGQASAPVPLVFVWMLGSVFFGYATFVLSGYFKDIEADRATGYSTLPVVAGRATAALVSHCFAALAVLMAVLAVEEFTPTTGALVGAGALAFLLGGIRLQSNRRDREAHRAIVPVVHGYILLLAGIASSRQPDWLVPLLVFYGSFWVVMRNRTEQSQV